MHCVCFLLFFRNSVRSGDESCAHFDCQTCFYALLSMAKPAAAVALEAELRELETQIHRIETVYLSRCGANLAQGWSQVERLAGLAPATPADAFRSQRVFSLSSSTSPLGEKTPFPSPAALLPPAGTRVIIVVRPYGLWQMLVFYCRYIVPSTHFYRLSLSLPLSCSQVHKSHKKKT